MASLERLSQHRSAVQSLLDSEAWSVVVRNLRLSEREAAIVQRILMLQDDEASIGDHLGMSPHTVHTHIERLYRKLEVTSRCQLVTRLFVTFAGMSR